MKKVLGFLVLLLIVSRIPLQGYDSTFMDYQNYNHGYCPECSCYPCRCGVPYNNNAQPVPPPPVPPPPPPCAVPAPCAPCAVPDPCEPCAPACGTLCGVSICAVGVAIAGVAAAAAIIIATSDPGSHAHP